MSNKHKPKNTNTMRKITKEMVNAFNNDLPFNKNNTLIKVGENVTNLFLHGNLIASKVEGRLHITNCGWFTNVTKERLNALPNVRIQQVKGRWFLNGTQWNGDFIVIENKF
jgi:hypothetical protein